MTFRSSWVRDCGSKPYYARWGRKELKARDSELACVVGLEGGRESEESGSLYEQGDENSWGDVGRGEGSRFWPPNFMSGLISPWKRGGAGEEAQVIIADDDQGAREDRASLGPVARRDVEICCCKAWGVAQNPPAPPCVRMKSHESAAKEEVRHCYTRTQSPQHTMQPTELAIVRRYRSNDPTARTQTQLQTQTQTQTQLQLQMCWQTQTQTRRDMEAAVWKQMQNT